MIAALFTIHAIDQLHDAMEAALIDPSHAMVADPSHALLAAVES